MKIAFFGTPEFASEILSWLFVFEDIDIKLVVSQPDRPVGRKREYLQTPVKQVALKLGIPLLQPEGLKNNSLLYEILKDLNLDFIVVVAYGKIIPKSLLIIPKYGSINLHGSILPKYRGASPVQAALRDGVSETGLTTMYMSERMDEWDILQIASFKVDKVDTSEDIFQRFVKIGPELLKNTLMKIQNRELVWTPQNHSEASYCSKINKEDGEIFFQRQSSEEIYNISRAYTPWPGIFTWYEWKRLNLIPTFPQWIKELSSPNQEVWIFLNIDKNQYGIICADKKILELSEIKLEGKKSMDIPSFVNGNKNILWYIFQ